MRARNVTNGRLSVYPALYEEEPVLIVNGNGGNGDKDC